MARVMSIFDWDRHSSRGAKMTTDRVAVDVSQDWANACDVQQRFMHHPGPTMDILSYSALCRQVCGLGGDCCDFLPLSTNRMALAVGDASGKSLAAAQMIAIGQSSFRAAAPLREMTRPLAFAR
jgi:serine phosphatase RsbU (regulator of sigma subunit)